MQSGEEFHRVIREWRNKEVDEAMLRTRPVDLIPVVQHADGQTTPLFLVSLHEELIKNPPGPLVADRKRFERVGHITSVQEEIHPKT